MATTHAEYLEYKQLVAQQLSQRKLKISELKDQLANLDVTHSKEALKSILDIDKNVGIVQSSPTKAKVNQRGLCEETPNQIKYRNQDERKFQENSNYEASADRYNELDYIERNRIDADQDEDQKFMNQQESRQSKNNESSAQKYEINEEVNDPLTNALFKNMKEKNEVFSNLKTRILNELGNLSAKQGEHDELEKLFRNKAVDVGQTEQLLKDEVNEVKERLEILSVIKAREKQISLKNKKKWLEALKKLEEEIFALKSKQSNLEAKIQKVRQEAEDIHTQEIKKFKEVLRESERAREKVEFEQERDSQRLEETEAELQLICKQIHDKEEEKALKEQMLKETEEKIRMLTTDISKFEADNPFLVQKFKSKIDLEKELAKLTEKITQMQLDVDDLDAKRVKRQTDIDKAEEAIKNEQERIKQINNTIKTVSEEDEESIRKIEVYFNRKKRESDMDYPSYTVYTTLRRFDTMKISDEITATMGDVISTLKPSLLSNVERTIKMLQEQIKDKALETKHFGETLKSHMRDHRANNLEDEKIKATLVSKFKELVNELRDLKLKKFKTELRLKFRALEIDKFVESQKVQKPELERTIHYNMTHLPFDNEIAEHVIDEKLRKPGCVTPEENIERVVADYYDLVRSRELKIQNLIEKKNNCYFIIKENQALLNELNSQSDESFYYRKAELTDLKIAANKIKKQLVETKANIEIEILDLGHNNFTTCYQRNLADKTRKMAKVYGPKVVNDIKGKYKRDITDATHMIESRKIQDYQAALDLLEEYKSDSVKLHKDLETSVPHELDSLNKQKNKVEEKLRRIKEQFIVISDAEKQIAKHIQNAINSKEEEIKEKIKMLFLNSKLADLEKELENVKFDIGAKEVDYKERLNASSVVDDELQSQSDSSQLNDLASQEGINIELLEEDLNLRKKYDDLKKAQQRLKDIIKPELKIMEDEHKAVEDEIKKTKCSIENLYEKYIEIRKGLKITKDTIANRPSEKGNDGALGSIEDPTIIDEIDQEIELLRNNKRISVLNTSKQLNKSFRNSNLSTSKINVKETKEKDHHGLAQVIPEKVVFSQLTSSLKISLHGTNTVYNVNLLDATPSEINFFEKILCFLEGRNIYNPAKLTETVSNSKRFRFIQITPDLQYFLVMNKAQFEKMKSNCQSLSGTESQADLTATPKKSTTGIGSKQTTPNTTLMFSGTRGYEQKLKICDLVKIVIPAFTRDIVKIQKNIKSLMSGEDVCANKDIQFGRFVHKGKKYTDEEMLALAEVTTEYPFTILFKNYELNVITTCYSDFRDIIKGIECLLSQNTKSQPNQPTSGLAKMLKNQMKRISVEWKEAK